MMSSNEYRMYCYGMNLYYIHDGLSIENTCYNRERGRKSRMKERSIMNT